MSFFKKISQKVVTNPIIGVFALLLVVLGGFFVSGAIQKASASTTYQLSGYAWSDNIGWISFNCNNNSSCSTVDYGVKRDAATGALSGYAWSENIGWISFNSSDLSIGTCPATTGSCAQAKIDETTGLTGWAKVLSGDACPSLSNCPKDSSGTKVDDQFDGWISFDCNDLGSTFCTDTSDYGITVSALNSSDQHTLSGSAWGGDVVGFIDMSGVIWTDKTVSVTLSATPTLILSGDSVKLTWTPKNANACSMTGNGWSGTPSAVDGAHTKTLTNVTSTTTPLTYSITCTDVDGNSAVATATVGVFGITDKPLDPLDPLVDQSKTKCGGPAQPACNAEVCWDASAFFASGMGNLSSSCTTYVQGVIPPASWTSSKMLNACENVTLQKDAITGNTKETTYCMKCSDPAGTSKTACTTITPDFGISANPTNINLTGLPSIDKKVSTTISISPVFGFAGNVSLSVIANDLPTNTSPQFDFDTNPVSAGSSAKLTVTVDTKNGIIDPAQTYNITVQGTSGSGASTLTHTAAVTINGKKITPKYNPF